MSNNPSRRFLAEGVLIVVSILVAFGLDASWDDYQTAKAEKLVLGELLSEFRDAERRIAASILELDTAISATTTLLAHLGPGAAAMPVETADSLVRQLLVGNTLEVPSSVMNSLTASGEIRLVSDPVLRGELTSWPALVADVLENHDWHRQATDEILVPHISQYVAVSNVVRLLYPLHETTPSSTATDVSRLQSDQVLEGLLAWRRVRQLATRRESRVLLEAANRVVGLLEDRLPPDAL